MSKVRAQQAAVVTMHGKPLGIPEGQPFDADDPVVRAYPWLFDAPVERATAAPGERRTVKRPA